MPIDTEMPLMASTARAVSSIWRAFDEKLKKLAKSKPKQRSLGQMNLGFRF